MYRNPAQDIIEFKDNILSSRVKSSYFEYQAGSSFIRITADKVRHIQNGHKLKAEECLELLQSIDNIKVATIVPGSRKPRGENVAIKITAPNNQLYGTVMAFANNGNIYLKTAFKSTDKALEE